MGFLVIALLIVLVPSLFTAWLLGIFTAPPRCPLCRQPIDDDEHLSCPAARGAR